MRFSVYERGLLRSVESAKRDGAYFETDDLKEAIACLKDILDFGLTGFIIDNECGNILQIEDDSLEIVFGD